MDEQNPNILEFDDFRIDPGKRLLFREDVVVPLMPKAFDTLFCLVKRAGTVVEKDTILAEVWPDTIVEENNLTQNISALRRAFGEKPGEHRYIVTVPGSGYKFVADVRRFSNPALESAGGSAGKLDYEATERTATDRGRLWLVALSVLIVLGVVSAAIYLRGDRADDTEAISSIAVLPFRPLTLESRDESLELGMADTLISKLGVAEGLTVRPLSAVRRFTALEQDPVDAGRRLGVQAVLDGSIQIAGDRVRVSARLFRVGDSKQMWAGQFDEKLTDIFSVQDSISERVASSLKVQIGRSAKGQATKNVEAYQLYARGRYHALNLIRPETDKALAYFQQAIELDPNYALPYVGIAATKRSMALTSGVPSWEVLPKAKEAAKRALEIDETLAEAHAVYGFAIFWYDWDWQSAEREYLRALELDPNSAEAHLGYAHLHANLGRFEKALAEVKIARELDPVSLRVNALEGAFLLFAGQSDQALERLQKAVDLNPDFWLSHLFLSDVYAVKGMYAEAVAEATKAGEISGNSQSKAYSAYFLAKSGRREEANRILKELQEVSTEQYVSGCNFAFIYNGLGETEKALDYLEKGFEERDVRMVFLKIDPKWDNLRSEPRFVELMRKMKFD